VQPRLAALAGGTQVALSRAGLEEATPAALAEVTRAVWEAVIRAEVTRVGLEESDTGGAGEATLAARIAAAGAPALDASSGRLMLV